MIEREVNEMRVNMTPDDSTDEPTCGLAWLRVRAVGDIKIVEGTAEQIEETAKSLEDYELHSLEYTFRSQVYLDDEEISRERFSFYVAVFKII